jgi:hypothetical protein
VRILTSSARGVWPAGVLITSLISRFFSRSSVFGRPSHNFDTRLTFNPAASSTAAVPPVATRSNPSSANCFATSATSCFCASLTLMNTLPVSGNGDPAAICDFA